MGTTANLSSIIRYYAEKQKTPFIDLKEFCAYVKKYAEHHVEEEGELVKYLGDPTSTITAELSGLAEKHISHLITNNGKKIIVAVSFFATNFATTYSELAEKENIPYPIPKELPKQFPLQLLEHKLSTEYLSNLIEHPTPKSTILYILDFTRDLPSILLPACVSIETLVSGAEKKIIKILKKEDFRDYYTKKLRDTNPTKEIAIKTFFQHFVDAGPNEKYDITQGDEYYIWNQTLYYLRQDFEKIQDRTTEDTNVLQSCQILEIYSTYIKQRMQLNQMREESLKALEAQLNKSPYFYSMNQILKFTDKHGKLLYGQYSEEDLKEFLLKLSTEGKENELPELLVFKAESGTRYYVFKKKLIQLLVRLLTEAHGSIEKKLSEKWYKSLLDFEKLPEMNDKEIFEDLLFNLVKEQSPILFALLNANFITIIPYENNIDETMQSYLIFNNGQLLPYSQLLMLSQSSLLSNVKVKLPFYYTFPIISWFIYLLHSKSTKKKNTTKKQTSNSLDSLQDEADLNQKAQKTGSKKEILASHAKEIAKELIPEGSTLDRELDYLNKQWNKMITKEANMQLTDDVNALIRDYMRRVISSLSHSTFTKERVEDLARTLARTPNMQKIKEEEALTEYIKLYILRLVSNS